MIDIYGGQRDSLEYVMKELEEGIRSFGESPEDKDRALYEHLLCRVKSEESMIEKCERKGLAAEPYSALRVITDAIGIRIVTGFLDDVYACRDGIERLPGVKIYKEKDYIKNVKPNGYRSYHMILDIAADAVDIDGKKPGRFFAEVQIRTIAMDSWAALEHKIKYKKGLKNVELITAELKRCADEMASTDVSMQTIRDLITGK
ncbi:MAG: GTP pyrophosphokinase family protein [Lachnospiraceae bacterium]|nr:GTP pyrophosphokinase family protein [Lachnospiraceae bacterium]